MCFGLGGINIDKPYPAVKRILNIFCGKQGLRQRIGNAYIRRMNYLALRQWRDKNGLSQADAGKIFGVTQPTWRRWETEGGFRLRLVDISRVTGLTFEELLADPEEAAA